MLDEAAPEGQTVLDLTKAEEGDTSERSLIAQLRESARLPAWAETRWKRVVDLRRYLEEEVYEFENDNAVNVNVIGRMINAKVAAMWPESPLLHATPEHRLQSDPINTAWAKVLGLIGNKLGNMAHIGNLMQSAIEDVVVDGVQWFKVEFIEDPSRDPLGTPRLDDSQDQFQRLRYLAERAAAGEFGEGHAEWQEMRDLHETISAYADQMVAEDPRRAAIAQLSGQWPPPPAMVPEPLKYKGVEITCVPGENVRLDWAMVPNLNALHRGRWLTEVHYDTPEAIAQKYDLTPNEARSIGMQSQAPTEQIKGPNQLSEYNTDPKDKEPEDVAHGGLVAVFCTWHRLNRRRYIYVDGVDRFLKNEIWAGELPWVPLVINTTPGRPIPVSVGLGAWKLQREINQTLSEGKAARRARYPRYAIKRGLASPEDLDGLKNAIPNAIIEMDEPEEIEKAIKEFRGADFDPRLYDPYVIMRLIEIEMGVTMQAAGLSNSGSTATEINTASSHMAQAGNMHLSKMHECLKQMYKLIMALACEYMTPEDVAFLLGPLEAQVWAMVPKNRNHILAGMDVDLMVAANGPAGREALARAWTAAGDAIARVMQGKTLAAAAGYDLNVAPMVEAITNNMGLGIPGDELVRPIMMPPPGMGDPNAQPGAQPGAGPQQAATGLTGMGA
jgi:hypothetical protein